MPKYRNFQGHFPLPQAADLLNDFDFHEFSQDFIEKCIFPELTKFAFHFHAFSEDKYVENTYFLCFFPSVISQFLLGIFRLRRTGERAQMVEDNFRGGGGLPPKPNMQGAMFTCQSLPAGWTQVLPAGWTFEKKNHV